MKIYHCLLKTEKNSMSYFFSHEEYELEEFEKTFPECMKFIVESFHERYSEYPTHGEIAEFENCSPPDLIELQKQSIKLFSRKEIQFEFGDKSFSWRVSQNLPPHKEESEKPYDIRWGW